MTNNYAELTNSEISAKIACMRGWRVEVREDGRGYIYAPNERLIGYYHTERLAWARAPRFASNLNRAWELFVEMTRAGTEGHACLIESIEKCATPARAICEAWLWWKEQQR